jgi:hypothetical protein
MVNENIQLLNLLCQRVPKKKYDYVYYQKRNIMQTRI